MLLLSQYFLSALNFRYLASILRIFGFALPVILESRHQSLLISTFFQLSNCLCCFANISNCSFLQFLSVYFILLSIHHLRDAVELPLKIHVDVVIDCAFSNQIMTINTRRLPDTMSSIFSLEHHGRCPMQLSKDNCA